MNTRQKDRTEDAVPTRVSQTTPSGALHVPSWDPTWEEVFRAQPWGKYPPEYVTERVLQAYRAEERSRTRVLDAGCGPGACTWFLAREGFEVAGIDGSETAIRLARERLAEARLSADLRVGDCVALPWKAGAFEAVLDNTMLCANRFEGCRRAVAEVHRVLRPGGRFFSCNISPATWGYRLGEQVERNGFLGVTEGPFAGKGFTLFMDRAQVDALYAIFAEVRVEQVRWSLGGMTHHIELWVVEAVKGADHGP